MTKAPLPPRAGSEKIYSAPALDKAFEIFEELAIARTGLTVSEIAQRRGRSISEIFRIMIVMERSGWLAKDPDTDRYAVTYKMLEIGHQATPAEELTHVAGPIMHALAAQTGQACHLVIPTSGHGLVIMREQAPGAEGFALRLGAQVNLLTSCSGRILLTYSTPEARDALLTAMPSATVRARATLAARSAEILARGYERAPSAITTAVTDISAPVFQFDGRAAAALTIPFLDYIDGGERMSLERALQALVAAAAAITRELGGRNSQRLAETAPASPTATRRKRRAD